MRIFGCAGFDWDEANLTHIARHDVAPAEVEQAVRDEQCLLESSEVRRGALRYNVTGQTADGRILTVIFEIRRYAIRTVTAYTAPKQKQAVYRKRRNDGNQAPIS
jgi:uncharacterized DUF497 family protein